MDTEHEVRLIELDNKTQVREHEVGHGADW